MIQKTRWNTVGRTRRKLAEILTAAVNERERRTQPASWQEVTVDPEEIYPMRLVGKVRAWEDAHSWEAFARFVRSGNPFCMLYSYSTMTEIVRAGAVDWIGKDYECAACPADNTYPTRSSTK